MCVHRIVQREEKGWRNEDGMGRKRKPMREDRDVKEQRSDRNQFPLGVAGSGQWSANATL